MPQKLKIHFFIAQFNPFGFPKKRRNEQKNKSLPTSIFFGHSTENVQLFVGGGGGLSKRYIIFSLY